MLQVNTSGEASKGGVSPEETLSLAQFVVEKCWNLRLSGLMTIGSVANASKCPNPDYELLKELKQSVMEWLSHRSSKDVPIKDTESVNNPSTVVPSELPHIPSNLTLSMGMSDDFEQAIRQGSGMLRIGSAIFGSRDPKSSIDYESMASVEETLMTQANTNI